MSKNHLAVVWIFLLLGCGSSPPASHPMKLANPASVHCGEVGGNLRIETLGNRGQIGVCYFDQNRQCEEWALFRNECPVGGLSVQGLPTSGARYCVIRGGQYEMTQAASGNLPEQGRCVLPRGTICDVAVLWQGSCG